MIGTCRSCGRQSSWVARRVGWLSMDAARLALRRVSDPSDPARLIEFCARHAGDYVVAGGVVDPIEAVVHLGERDRAEARTA